MSTFWVSMFISLLFNGNPSNPFCRRFEIVFAVTARRTVRLEGKNHVELKMKKNCKTAKNLLLVTNKTNLSGHWCSSRISDHGVSAVVRYSDRGCDWLGLCIEHSYGKHAGSLRDVAVGDVAQGAKHLSRQSGTSRFRYKFREGVVDYLLKKQRTG